MMSSQVRIPQGDDRITIELTVKEAMALSTGVRFNQDRKLKSDAQSKIRHSLEQKLIPHSDKVPYQSLDF
jgi:hypothetical protein